MRATQIQTSSDCGPGCTLITIFPRARPLSEYRTASETSLGVCLRSITGVTLPACAFPSFIVGFKMCPSYLYLPFTCLSPCARHGTALANVPVLLALHYASGDGSPGGSLTICSQKDSMLLTTLIIPSRSTGFVM